MREKKKRYRCQLYDDTGTDSLPVPIILFKIRNVAPVMPIFRDSS